MKIFKKHFQSNLIILGTIILIVIIVIQCKKEFPTTTDSVNISSPTPPERPLDCSSEINNLYLKNDKSISSLTKLSKQIKWNGTKYNLIVFDCPNPEEYAYGQVFTLSKVSDNDTEEKILFTMADSIINDFDLKDINKDGLAELEISSSNGGNCENCGGYSVFKLVGGQVEDLFPDFSKAEGDKYAKVSLSDLNKDGIEDVLVTSDYSLRGAEQDFLNYTIPKTTTIYSWKDGKYQDCSNDFINFYQNQITERNKNYKKIIENKENNSDSFNLTQQIAQIAVENYFDYSSLKKYDLGFDTFIRQIDYDSFSKTIILNDSDKVWLNELKQDITRIYKNTKPTKIPLY